MQVEVVADSEVVDQASIERKLGIPTFLGGSFMSFVHFNFILVLHVINERRGDENAFAHSGETHTSVQNGSINTLRVVVALEEIDGAEEQIHMQVVVHEIRVVVAVSIRLGVIGDQEVA